MNDNFDIGKWNKELILRNYSINEVQNDNEKKRIIEDILTQIFPQAQYIRTYLPTEDGRVMGKAKIGMKEDISKDDLYFSSLEMEKVGFIVDPNKSRLYYDVDSGEEKLYPVLYFTYL